MKRLLAVLSVGVMAGLGMLTSGKGPDPTPDAAATLPLAQGAIHPRISPDGQGFPGMLRYDLEVIREGVAARF